MKVFVPKSLQGRVAAKSAPTPSANRFAPLPSAGVDYRLGGAAAKVEQVRTPQVPCFAGDVVQFTVSDDNEKRTPNAKEVSVVSADAEIEEGFFTGVIKNFFVDKGWGFISSPGAQAVYKKDVFVHKHDFLGYSDEQMIQMMEAGVRKIQQLVESSEGRIPVDCEQGSACPRPTCGKAHPGGRDFLERPELLLCRYKQRCRNARCFYIHLEGREIDNDPEKGMCRDMDRCTNLKCLFSHPPGRINPRELASRNDSCHQCGRAGHLAKNCPQSRCYACGQRGHMTSACPQGGDARDRSQRRYKNRNACVTVRNFPAAWADLGSDEFREHIVWDLSVFGPLVEESVEFGADRARAFAEFEHRSNAQAATEQLCGEDEELLVEMRFSEDTEETAIVHLDELLLPVDTDEPFSTDAEVWVPEADDDELETWVRRFGEVDEFYRPPGATIAGFPAGGCYVKFAHHTFALKCVEEGVAGWSASERAMAHNGGTMVNALLAHGGQCLKAMRDELGLRVLHLGALDRTYRSRESESSRLHFVARGPASALRQLRALLENRVTQVVRERKPRKRTYITEPVVPSNPKKPRKAPFVPSGLR